MQKVLLFYRHSALLSRASFEAQMGPGTLRTKRLSWLPRWCGRGSQPSPARQRCRRASGWRADAAGCGSSLHLLFPRFAVASDSLAACIRVTTRQMGPGHCAAASRMTPRASATPTQAVSLVVLVEQLSMASTSGCVRSVSLFDARTSSAAAQAARRRRYTPRQNPPVPKRFPRNHRPVH